MLARLGYMDIFNIGLPLSKAAFGLAEILTDDGLELLLLLDDSRL